MVHANPTQTVALSERINLTLLSIIRDNIVSQYGSQAVLLAEFRDAVAKHGTTDVDATLADFRAHVPLSNYDSYKPLLDKFNVQPCKEENVINMFAPGLPDFLVVSSGTSGANPKIILKYNHSERLKIPARRYFDATDKDPLAAVLCTEYRDVKVIERAPGDVSRRIPVCIASGGLLRRTTGCYIDDETPGFVAPWAATTIGYFPSFLIIHGLLFLANRNVCKFQVPIAAQFIDLDMLVSCIRDGTIPDLEGIDHVHFHPNPERAAELGEIGPPSSLSSEGWFSRVWPKTTLLWTVCSGPFATVLPKVRFILGPNIPVRCPGYISSKALIGLPHDPNKPEEFVLVCDDVIEFLDVSLDATHENLCQAWEVEVGKHYEPILTTRDGLWRYRLGDIIHMVGFDAERKSPVFKYAGRRALTLRFPFTQITDDQLLASIHTFSSEDAVRVQEFTTVIDDRALLPTVGFFVELAGPLGPNAHLAPQKLFDALVATNVDHRLALELGKIRLPTIRIVKAGTFAEYRQWKGEKANITSVQVKVPLILLDPTLQEWISERVIQEV
ncbi:GH3 auxin-responsive promoter domain containing protein [Tylopilus felleus]